MMTIVSDVFCLVVALHMAVITARHMGDGVAWTIACIGSVVLACVWAAVLLRDLARDRYPQCCGAPRIVKVLYMGMPGRFCQSCTTLSGPSLCSACAEVGQILNGVQSDLEAEDGAEDLGEAGDLDDEDDLEGVDREQE